MKPSPLDKYTHLYLQFLNRTFSGTCQSDGDWDQLSKSCSPAAKSRVKRLLLFLGTAVFSR